jgi:hypothetical protein
MIAHEVAVAELTHDGDFLFRMGLSIPDKRVLVYRQGGEIQAKRISGDRAVPIAEIAQLRTVVVAFKLTRGTCEEDGQRLYVHESAASGIGPLWHG